MNTWTVLLFTCLLLHIDQGSANVLCRELESQYCAGGGDGEDGLHHTLFLIRCFHSPFNVTTHRSELLAVQQQAAERIWTTCQFITLKAALLGQPHWKASGAYYQTPLQNKITLIDTFATSIWKCVFRWIFANIDYYYLKQVAKLIVKTQIASFWVVVILFPHLTSFDCAFLLPVRPLDTEDIRCQNCHSVLPVFVGFCLFCYGVFWSVTGFNVFVIKAKCFWKVFIDT